MAAEVTEFPATTFVVRGGELDGWLAERKRLGQDGRDEVWDGVYHVVPHADSSHGMLAQRLGRVLWQQASSRKLLALGEFNLGTHSRDYRVPDMGWITIDRFDGGIFLPTVDIVVEFESPDDETWDKVPFYLARGVREIWVITPHTHQISIVVGANEEDHVPISSVMGVTVREIQDALGWRGGA